ncbi:MAG: ABC transporter permease [Actinomycetota bacterium]|nr:ABC transporter permease [Actinomycetota bacterium]
MSALSERSAQPVPDPFSPAVTAGGAVSGDVELSHESGLELKARSQWTYARIRFFRHKLAVASMIVLIIATFVAVFPGVVAPYAFDEFDFEHIVEGPTLEGWHLFGTDQLGRDYLSRVIYGLQTSLFVAFLVASIATVLGTIVGAVAGYYGGVVDNLLMRLVDLILVVPFLAVLLVLSAYLGQGKPWRVGVIVALLAWVGLARIVRGTFLSLREKEFVEAARAAGAGDMRIMFRHMLPSTVGPIVVTMTLLIAAAILLEAALSFLGFGVQPPTPALGVLIGDGASEGFSSWWLVTFPGIVIVTLALAVNFIGDGLRDALDPQQRVRA